MFLSIVVPCYNEQDNGKPFFKATTEALKDFTDDYEIVFVNDGSSDNTYKKLTDIYNANNDFIKVVNFSRNFGKEAALLAGLENTIGEYVAIIDADLQQNPNYIKDMYNILKDNPEFDSVAAYQDLRNEGKVLSKFKDCFYSLINKLTEIKLFRSASDFRLLKRVMVNAIIALPEKSRFSKGIFSWVGFNTYYMPYTVQERNSGASKWSFWKLTRYAIDGIVTFSNRPLLFAVLMGVIMGFVSLALFITALIAFFGFGASVGLIVIIATIFLVSSIQMVALGVLGEYFSKMYTEVKNRPMYITKNKLEKEDNK